MRIISKFSDYYDSCLSYGHDETVTYLRNLTHFPEVTSDTPNVIRELFKWYSDNRSGRSLPIRNFVFKKTSYVPTELTLLFCGKVYRGIMVSESNTWELPYNTTTYIWDIDSAVKYFSERGIDMSSKYRQYWYGGSSKYSREDTLREYYRCDPPNLDWMIANKITNILFNDRGVFVNPCLKDIQFFKAMDAFTAFQALDVWVSGTLSYPQNMIVEIEDKYRIEQHGFDMKYGFRKRPSK